ncbi:MAG: WD40/YVTN/BNR-like repeat-containing protein [Enterobacteriaceae bacterium]
MLRKKILKTLLVTLTLTQVSVFVYADNISISDKAKSAEFLMIGGNEGTISCSDDGGKVWQRYDHALDTTANVTSFFKISKMVYLAGTSNGEIYRSKEKCLSWEKVYSPESIMHPLKMKKFVKLKGKLFAIDGYNIYRSQDQGNHWESIKTTGYPEEFETISALNNKGILWVGVAKDIYRWKENRPYGIYSDDGGDSWNQQQLPESIVKVADSIPTDDNTIVVIGTKEDPESALPYNNPAAIYSSDGVNWQEGTFPSELRQEVHDKSRLKYIQRISGNRLLATSYLFDKKVYFSYDNGKTWSVHVNDIYHLGSRELFVGGIAGFDAKHWVMVGDEVSYGPHDWGRALQFTTFDGGSTWNMKVLSERPGNKSLISAKEKISQTATH